MKTFTKTFLPSVVALSLVACGGGGQKTDSNTTENPAVNTTSSPVNAANAMANAANAMSGAANNMNAAAQQKMQARRAKGDTLAMPYADLAKFLPASLDGYTADPLDGATVNMGKMSYSTATIKYKKANGDWVKVAIIDYNQTFQMYSAATAVWAMGYSVDTPQEKANALKLDNTDGGWESYQKNTKNATLALGVGSRFYVTVEANNQSDMSNIESVAKSVDLSKLSSL